MQTEASEARRYEIRELSVGGILDDAIVLFKRRFGLILGILCCLYIPYEVAFAFVQWILFPTDPLSFTYSEAAPLALMLSNILVLPYSLVKLAVVMPLTFGALVFAVASEYLGQPLDFRQCWARTKRVAPKLMAAVILSSILEVLGACLCVIPGVFLMLVLAVYAETIALENAGVIDAISRSWNLVKPNLLKAFVLFLLLSVIGMGISMLEAIGPPWFLFVNRPASGIAVAIGIAAWVVFYFSCRCQRENLDLDLLVVQVDVAPAAEGPML